MVKRLRRHRFVRKRDLGVRVHRKTEIRIKFSYERLKTAAKTKAFAAVFLAYNPIFFTVDFPITPFAFNPFAFWYFFNAFFVFLP